jgi:hypothetical protein
VAVPVVPGAGWAVAVRLAVAQAINCFGSKG